ncbi:hypothetical protein GCM10023238_26280 [Streptomyces heliomycini]
MKVFFDVITNHTADVVDYEEKSYGYLSKGAFPYLTKDGEPFDDADYADGSRRFPRVDGGSFPRTPVVPDAKKRVKVPSWLNDPEMYHNRATPPSSASPASTATSPARRPVDRAYEVVDGMEKIYSAVGEGLRHRRLPDRHREAQSHGVLDPMGHRPGRLRGKKGRTTSSCSARSTPPTRTSPPRTSPGPPRRHARLSTLPGGGTAVRLPGRQRAEAGGRLRRRLQVRHRQGHTPTSRSPSSATTTWAASGRS